MIEQIIEITGEYWLECLMEKMRPLHYSEGAVMTASSIGDECRRQRIQIPGLAANATPEERNRQVGYLLCRIFDGADAIHIGHCFIRREAREAATCFGPRKTYFIQYDGGGNPQCPFSIFDL